MAVLLLIGIVAGLRSMVPLAAVSWAAKLGWIHPEAAWMAWIGYAWTPYIFTVLALAELANDKAPWTASRKQIPSVIIRAVSGGFCAACLGASAGLAVTIIAGVVGSLIGTYGGAWVRGKLAAAFGKDLPAALLEDVVAIALAFVAVKGL